MLQSLYFKFVQGSNITDQELQQKVQTILMGLLADQENRQEQMYADQRKQLNEAQIAALATHRLGSAQ